LGSRAPSPLNTMSHPAQAKIPPEAESEVLAMRARGTGSQVIANWLLAKHGSAVSRQHVEQWLNRRHVRAGAVLPALPESSKPSLDDQAILDAFISAELDIWKDAKTLPERRAAAAEVRRCLDLRRGVSKSQDDGKTAERDTTMREILSLLRRQPVPVVVEMSSVAPDMAPIPPDEPSK
jgi:hypothetical protein